ncbi:hypothetical protein VDP57_10715 [Xanthomonas campestris pv. campestris]|uniref:hypothetical protein n=1 Tax=Xanthomonas campestris TaxID=339 RepID=UPI00226981E9|nr:hypothetical protein [Xanthomonas campestris]MEB1347820.1 hypothetical protein [Xanthomonas campestris pv. campestris]
MTTKTKQLDGRINGKPELDWIRAMVDHGIRRYLPLADGPEATRQYQSFVEKMAAFRGEIQVAQAYGSFKGLLHRYRAQGRLQSTSPGHSRVQAQSEQEAPSQALPEVPIPASEPLTGPVSAVPKDRTDHERSSRRDLPHD